MPPVEQLGPRMKALGTDLIRRFVWEYVDNGGNATRAANDAGYSTKSRGANPAGYRNLQSPEVIAAIEEVTWSRLHSAIVPAVKGLEALVRDPLSKFHMKAIEMVMDRVPGFASKSEHTVKVEHTLTIDEMKDRVRNIATRLQLDPQKLLASSQTVDVEYSEVEDLSDILK